MRLFPLEKFVKKNREQYLLAVLALAEKGL